MNIKPEDLSETHVGMLCVVRFSTSGTGFTGHSQKHGLESGSASTLYILVGRLHSINDNELTFTDCHYSRHKHDLSYSLRPRYKSDNGPYAVKRQNIHDKKIVLNHLPSSNAVMQHLTKVNKSEFWNRERRIASMLKQNGSTP